MPQKMCEFYIELNVPCGKLTNEKHACCGQFICEEHYDKHTDYCYCDICY